MVRQGLTSWTLVTFRSLKNPNYRNYAIAQLVSSCGSWVQLTAISWLVFDLTNSAMYLGTVSFLRQSPVLLFGFLGGWVADHFDRRRILISTKVVMMVQAMLLGTLTLTNNLNIWMVMILATTLGIANAIDMPSKQAFTFNLVEKKDLVNAVSLNSSSFHTARTLGPVIAALIVHHLGNRTGESTCFFLNAASFLVVIATLVKLKELSLEKADKSKKKTFDLKESLAFAAKHEDVKVTCILGAVTAFLCMQYIVMMPVFAKDVFQMGMNGFGTLMASAAVGSFLASLALANKGQDKEHLKKYIKVAAVAMASTLVIFANLNNFYLACLAATVLGFSGTTQLSGSNSLIQLAVDDSLRGRVLSLWMITVSGLGPTGGLIVGWAAQQYGAPVALTASGIVAGTIALVMLFVDRSRA